MMQPRVSLLVPIYNVEKYLRKCLDSAQNQTLHDIEIICINDGSKDSSRSIIQEYLDADERFRVIDKENSGYGISMNMGLEAARGEYVGILESDDYFEPDALEKLITAADKFNAQVAKANFWFYWSKPEEKNVLFEVATPDMANRLVNTQKEYEAFYRKNSIWSAIYRRDFLNDNNIHFLETPGASYQDTAFDFKVWACATRVTFLHEAIIHYRQDNEASSVNSPSKVYCVCDEYNEIERFLDEHPEKNFLLTIEKRMKFDTYMWNYERLADDLKFEFLERCSEDFRKDAQAGLLDMQAFDRPKRQDLEAIMRSPEKYHAWHSATHTDSAFTRAKLLLDAKGWHAFFSALFNRLTR